MQRVKKRAAKTSKETSETSDQTSDQESNESPEEKSYKDKIQQLGKPRDLEGSAESPLVEN